MEVLELALMKRSLMIGIQRLWVIVRLRGHWGGFHQLLGLGLYYLYHRLGFGHFWEMQCQLYLN